jgi:hypothetical protein
MNNNTSGFRKGTEREGSVVDRIRTVGEVNDKERGRTSFTSGRRGSITGMTSVNRNLASRYTGLDLGGRFHLPPSQDVTMGRLTFF